MIHLLASFTFGTVYAVVPLRTFVSTIIGAGYATKFDIYTGAVILPASGTLGGAIQPNCRPDKAGCKKRLRNSVTGFLWVRGRPPHPSFYK